MYGGLQVLTLYLGNICKIMRLCETILAGCSFLISIICNRYAATLVPVVALVVTYTYYTRHKKQHQSVHGSTLFTRYEAVFPFAASPSCGNPAFYDFQGPLAEATIVAHYNLRIQKCPDTCGRDLKDSKISIPRCNFVPFHVALSSFKYP